MVLRGFKSYLKGVSFFARQTLRGESLGFDGGLSGSPAQQLGVKNNSFQYFSRAIEECSHRFHPLILDVA